MNVFSLIAAVIVGEDVAEPIDLSFFEKIWKTIVTWFIDERGWLSIVNALLVILVGLIVIKIILTILRKIINRGKLKGIAGNFIVTLFKIILLFIYFIAILRVLGIDTSSFIALLTVGTLAISLAIQSVISNFASGIILVTNHPFKESDFVEVAGVSGTVEKITLFSTKIKTTDNKVISVPNSSVASANIINYSTEENRRVDMTFGVAYGTDIDKAKTVMTSELDNHPLVLHDEGYTVRLNEQADSALIFVCRCWTKNADYWTVYFDLTESMTKRFEKEGIEIPYNKLDVNVISQQASAQVEKPKTAKQKKSDAKKTDTKKSK